MRTIICRHCGRKIQRNKRLKHLQQHYCGAKACQSARKQLSERIKYQKDASYRARKLQRTRDRFKTKEERVLRGNYQRDYRASHPDYVLNNRQKQRVRNARRAEKLLPEGQIVNPDTLTLQPPDCERVYAMIPMKYEKIVNPDTLMPYLTVIEGHTKQKPLFVRLL